MQVTVIGANGKTGRLVVDLLADAGHQVRAMVRAPEQQSRFERDGVTPVLGDLEGDFAGALEGADAAVFAAGSGSKTGPDKTLTVDLLGAVRSIDACADLGVGRYVMLSSIRADDPMGSDRIRHYLAAKHAADRILAGSDLDWTIVRPGGLTDDPGTGRVRLAGSLERGRIPRADVAAVLAACIDAPETVARAFDLVGGDTPIDEAIASLR